MVTEKINEYIVAKGISMYAFENSLGVSRGSISKAVKENKSIGSQVLENILSVYSDLNPDWLLTGRGSMLRMEQTSTTPPVAQSVTQADSLGESSTYIYKMYEKKDGENKVLIEELGGLKERLRSMEQELSALKAKHGHNHEQPPLTEVFTGDSSNIYGKDLVPMTKSTLSKRSSAGKI